MAVPLHNSWLHRFALLTAAVTFLLLGVGGLVTSHGVGMAVPDWPNTYGYNMFLFPFSRWVGGIFYEHSHRLIASLVGLLTTILAVWLWMRETRGRTRWLGLTAALLVLVLMGARQLPVYVALASLALVVIAAAFWQAKKNPGTLRWLGVTALATVILQGVLGGLRVVWLADEIGIFHATLAQLFFVLVCSLGLVTSQWWEKSSAEMKSAVPEAGAPMRRLALVVTLLVLCQLVLGATMRHQHAGLAIPDFPLAYGKLWPAMDSASVAEYNRQRLELTEMHAITAFQIGLQMAHRLMAVAILAGVGWVAWRSRRREEADNAGSHKNPPPYVGGYGAGALRRLAFVWLGLILVQAGLGAWTIWSNKAADVATVHVLVGALSLVTGALWCLIAFRRPAKQVESKTAEISAAEASTLGMTSAIAGR
jgi:cytochrome c oxidase assembly protein subunit 15